MSVVIVDGGPRKNWNTAQMLAKVAQGALSAGAEVEQFRLYDLQFKGCISCFACKRKGVVLETCAQKDALLPVLQAAYKADALVLGSPVYFGEVTGMMRMFFERLCFPYLGHYDNKPSFYGREIPAAMVYTMNSFPAEFDLMHMTGVLARYQDVLGMLFGKPLELMATETYQFDDYSKYQSSSFDVAARKERHDTVFPQDLQKAFDLGVSLVS